MTLVLNGTTGVSSVDGSASTPAVQGGDSNTGVFFPAADTVAIATGGTERVRTDSSGNVGIGVTPSAWQASRKALQVVNSSLHNISGNTFVANNFYSDGTSRYIANGFAGLYGQESNGSHAWYTAPSGTAGNAISWTQAMTLDASGNWQLGSTSNPNTARMYVRYDGVSTQPVINSASTTAAGTGWSHFIGQSGNGSSITTNNVFIRGNGNLENANNSYAGISDIKLKENVTDATPKLEKLCQVRVVNYNLKADFGYEQHKQIGVIAQELEQIFPGMVEETPDRDAEGNDLGTTTKSVKYSVFVPMLIKAMQEQQALINDLTARIAALEGAKA